MKTINLGLNILLLILVISLVIGTFIASTINQFGGRLFLLTIILTALTINLKINK